MKRQYSNSISRFVYIDIFKAVGIIFMVMGHVGFGDWFDKFIHSFHMPMFFLISGMLFKEKSEISTRGYIRKKAKSLLMPYFVWGFIQYIIWQAFRWPQWDFKPLINLFLINSDGLAIAGALWFLTALFIADVLYFIIRRYIKSRYICDMVIAILALLGNLENAIFPFKLPYSLGAACVGVGLLHIGWLLFNYENTRVILSIRLKTLIMLTIVVIILIFQNGYINMRIGEYSIIPLFWVNAVLATIVGINLSKYVENIKFIAFINELNFIGRNSIIYVCFNQIIIMFITYLLGNIFLLKLFNKMVILIATMLLLRIIAVISLNTKLKYLFGK